MLRSIFFSLRARHLAVAAAVYLPLAVLMFGSWAGSVWNMVFQGVQGAPPQHVPNPSHTTIDTTPVVRENYKIGVPQAGRWIERINTDAGNYGGSNVGNSGQIWAEPSGWQGRSASVSLTLPPLSTSIFEFSG